MAGAEAIVTMCISGGIFAVAAFVAITAARELWRSRQRDRSEKASLERFYRDHPEWRIR